MEKVLTDIEMCFRTFANGNTEMNNTQFLKLCKSCGFIDAKFTMIDADLTFSKVKANPTSRTIYFKEFQKAVDGIAKKRGMQARDVVQRICETKGPQYVGTKTVNTKLYEHK